MPELPEVETFVRSLQPAVGAVIRRVDVLDARLALDPTVLVGATITSVERRGKHIVLRLGEQGDLVIHLRMSGRLQITTNDDADRYTRLILHLDSGDVIRFVNPRRLGTATHRPDGFDNPLGVEPLTEAFTPARFGEMVRASRSPVKQLLMDQRRIAGLGNIYAAESLWHAAISPKRPANTLTEEEIDRLHRAIRTVLQRAIDQLGTTLGTSVSDYRPAEAKQGGFQNELAVYGREKLRCTRCGTMIRRIRQAGRSTCYCPTCQR